MKAPKKILIITLVFFLAVFLRGYHLSDQGMFFFDEGEMVHKAYLLKAVFSSNSLSVLSEGGQVEGDDSYLFPSGVYSKGLWLWLIRFVQGLTGDISHSAQYLSFFFGILSVGMTYLFAKRFYLSDSIGVLSALLLGISSLHVFYSRLALAESASTFFLLLSLYFYLRGGQGTKQSVGLSGMFAGMAFLINRFRVGLLPVFIFMLDKHMRKNQKDTSPKDKHYIILFLLYGLAVVLSWQVFIEILRFFGFHLPGYFAVLKGHIVAHSTPRIDTLSFLSFPLYILKFEGWPILVLMVVSLFFIRGNPSVLFPLTVVLLQMFVSSMLDEKGIRSISVVLPFLSILGAVTLFQIGTVFNKNFIGKFLFSFFCCVVFLTGLQKAREVLLFQSDMPKVIHQLNEWYSGKSIVTTNLPMVSIYSSAKTIRQLTNEDFSALKGYLNEGYELILVDPQCLVTASLSNFWVLKYSALVDSIKEKCTPIIIADHFDRKLLEWFIFEHSVHLKETLSFLQKLDKDAGKIKVYSLKACLDSLAK